LPLTLTLSRKRLCRNVILRPWPKNLDFVTAENARCFALLSMTSMRLRVLRHSLQGEREVRLELRSDDRIFCRIRVSSLDMSFASPVMPAKAGIQTSLKFLDSDSPPLSRGLAGMTTELFNRFWGRHTSEPD